ncbi:MAG: prepilin peptidase [Candidatus Paceibacterota bacterium]
MIETLFYIISFLLGLIIGSFLNVVIYRQNTGRGILGRSFCFACRAQLSPFDLVPVFSFLRLRGRCRTCYSRISIQYPLVELLTGFVFALLAWQYFPFDRFGALSIQALIVLFLYWTIAGILIVITVYDFKHKIIPDDFTYAFIILAVFVPFLERLPAGLGEALARTGNGILAAGLLFAIFWALWRYSDGRWMGFGDVKLVIGIGLLLGLLTGLTAVFIAFWSGAIVGLLLILLGRLRFFKKITGGLTLKSELPFAPFLVLATLLGLIFQFNLLWF